jgi:hypothetical protein
MPIEKKMNKNERGQQFFLKKNTTKRLVSGRHKLWV